ncbi:helix-turn-helix transcriptional regulator [Actinotalea solisilvae]|uniref:helix-turn-helix transcriptional regulator n=1 Tax=Actinotalea solisilvae TaxID=2072922 RepID=UPI0018F24B11|nr:WYL domain-containing protein [Actinotalea solisilvae]
MTDLRPTARALRTLDLLQHRPGVTAQEIADELDVTERAARRYVSLLREAGIPVEAARGRYGGYRLGRGVRLPPVVFTASEALGLVMAVLDGHHAAADPQDPVGAALGKVIRAMPEGVGRQAATVRRFAAAAPDRRADRPDPDITSALVEAVGDQRRVAVDYRSASGASWRGEVDPWAVVVRHGRWYLLCHAHRTDAVRAYRVDRIAAVEPRQDRFRAPDDLNPVALLEEHLGRGWPYATRVVFDAPADVVARYVRPPMGRLDPLDDGARCALVGTTANPVMYAGEWLAAIPLPFRVEGGPELRGAVGELAARLTAAVGRATVPGR